jgi:hypothetical protein
VDEDATMPTPAVATRPPWTWKVLLFGASLAAFGLSALAYLGDDSTGPLPLRVMMALLMPLVTVGGGFAAGQMRQADPQK